MVMFREIIAWNVWNSSKRSLKCILLHNEKEYARVTITHSTKLKKDYWNIWLVLDNIKYNTHKWQTCVGSKMENILLDQQSGFISLWDSKLNIFQNLLVPREMPPNTHAQKRSIHDLAEQVHRAYAPIDVAPYQSVTDGLWPQ